MTTYARICLHDQESDHIVRSRRAVFDIETRLRARQPRNTFFIHLVGARGLPVLQSVQTDAGVDAA
jgi:hypothetical protein